MAGQTSKGCWTTAYWLEKVQLIRL